MEQLHFCQVSLPRILHNLWQHSHPILSALAIASSDLLRRKIQIFHSYASTLHQSQAGAREQTGHEMRHVLQVG